MAPVLVEAGWQSDETEVAAALTSCLRYFILNSRSRLSRFGARVDHGRKTEQGKCQVRMERRTVNGYWVMADGLGCYCWKDDNKFSLENRNQVGLCSKRDN